MDASTIKELLKKARTIAVIGANDNPGRPVDRVGRYLIKAGYTVFPVHPVRKSVWSLPCFSDLASIGQTADIINVFRAREHCPHHASEAATLTPHPGLFWMQLGIESPEAAEILVAAGIPFVQNACLMVEHMHFFHNKSITTNI